MQEEFRLGLTGSSRRCDNPVIEQLISLNEVEIAALPASQETFRQHLDRVLSAYGLTEIRKPETVPDPVIPAGLLGWFYASLAIGFQRCIGHRVYTAELVPRSRANEFHAFFEYEHWDVGWNSARLAMAILCEAFPDLEWPGEMQPPFEDFEREWSALKALACDTILPADTEALIMAARRLGIPCVKLERDPYQGLEGDFRIRRNSMLKLGHCAHQLVLDGMLCINRSQALIESYHDRMSLIRLSETYDFPIPLNQNDYRHTGSYEDAREIAGLLQYPVVVKTRQRSHGENVSAGIRNPAELQTVVSVALKKCPQVLIEKHMPGSTYHVLCVGLETIAVVNSAGEDVASISNNSITSKALEIARGTGAGMLDMTVVTPDISQSLADAPGVVVDLDFSPRLDRFLQPGSELMQQIAEEFLRWLFPDDAPCSIPIVAITGTNGKTTTSRMTARILAESGLTTALCCTDGTYRNGELLTRKADSTGDAFLKQLEDLEVQAAVLETHFGRISRLGFPWQECDVGVCTNVTGDHVGRLGIETQEEMSLLKRSVPDRARHVVLNADDPCCMAMLPDFQGKHVTLTTLRKSDEVHVPDHAGRLDVCSIEHIDGRDSIVLTQGGESLNVIAVSDIPATFNGAARFNISNAQQAVAACRAVGIPPASIKQVLTNFEMSISSTPGRLNIHDNGRYRVMLDFAHNVDGLNQLGHFTDGLEVTGRRIIMHAPSARMSDELLGATVRASIRYFDMYICYDYGHGTHRPVGELPQLMRKTYESEGVAPHAIKEMIGEKETLDYALSICQDGDLLVVQVETGNFEKRWRTIIEAEK